MKKSRKKKIVITIIVILVVFAGIVGYTVISDLKQEEKLSNELSEIVDLTSANLSDMDIDKINEKLDNIITTGDYATVEKAFKSYMKDAFNSLLQIVDVLEDEKITTLLTVENYSKDGKEFTDSKKYISDMIKKLETYKEDYHKYMNKEKAMSYIENKGLDSYYTDLYEKEYIGDINSLDLSELDDSIDELISILKMEEEVLNLLSDDPNSWTIQGKNIVFSDNNILDKYNNLVKIVETEITKI